MDEKDLIRLRHMQDAIHTASRFIEGVNREDLTPDSMLVLALTRAIEIIGEAASRVSKETRESLPQIPWAQIVGMRNRLIHAYFDVNLDRLWDTAVVSLPALAEQLETIIPSDEE